MKKHDLVSTRVLWAAALFAAFFLLCTCTAKSQSASGTDMAKAFADAGLRLLTSKVSPRDFSLPTLADETVSLSQLKGKVVFLNFWATWCGPCRAEMPSMETLYALYKEKGLEILAVNCSENRQEVAAFMQEYGLSFSTLLDEDGKVRSIYGIQAIPTSYLIDRDGMIVARIVGSINWDTPEIFAAIETLLNA